MRAFREVIEEEERWEGRGNDEGCYISFARTPHRDAMSSPVASTCSLQFPFRS